MTEHATLGDYLVAVPMKDPARAKTRLSDAFSASAFVSAIQMSRMWPLALACRDYRLSPLDRKSRATISAPILA